MLAPIYAYFLLEWVTVMDAYTSPPNSMLLVMDRSSGALPEAMNGKLVSASTSCVAVGTLSEFDGETHVVLTKDRQQETNRLKLVYDGWIETPANEISVCNILDEPILTLTSISSKTRVQISVNDDREPDEIHIAINSVE